MTTFNIKAFLKNLSTSPGVYVMHNATDDIIYIGKAKNLKKRVTSYFQKDHPDQKTRALVEQIARIEINITHTENEALLLESNLIKKFRPRYNVIFRDDKSYPYIFLSQHGYPRVMGIRGKQKKGDYFGPYPSMKQVRETLTLIQKVFQLRSCEDSFFKNRTRPCLLYQIKRCSGPCVDAIDVKEYQVLVKDAKLFLSGKDQDILKSLSEKMQSASNNLEFEKAAALRDRMIELRKLRETQNVETSLFIDADMVYVYRYDSHYMVNVLFVRQGKVLGNQQYFPGVSAIENEASLMKSFIEQFYFQGFGRFSLPKEIVTNVMIEMDEDVKAFFQSIHHYVPVIKAQVRGLRKEWLQLSKMNAMHALQSKIGKNEVTKARFLALQKLLGRDKPIENVICFDISHNQGTFTVASLVAFDENGANKKAYRRFNIAGIQKSDDYAAMEQALYRYGKRLVTENKPIANVILIDGGKGQLRSAHKALQMIDLNQQAVLIGVAKGVERKSGREELWFIDRAEPLILDESDPAFLLIREVRDEAHRFAVMGHRKRREKAGIKSVLEEIPGLGPKRRQALLHHFGGWQELKDASVEEIAKVPGISRNLAIEIVKLLKEFG